MSETSRTGSVANPNRVRAGSPGAVVGAASSQRHDAVTVLAQNGFDVLLHCMGEIHLQ